MIRSLLVALGLPLLIGCGSGLANVSGTVTYDGKPLAGGGDVRGTVTFVRADGSGTPAIGILDENGHYELSTGADKGAAPGAYMVAISATRVIVPEGGGTPSGRPITPRRYASAKASRLTAEVEPDSNTVDFALEARSSR